MRSIICSLFAASAMVMVSNTPVEAQSVLRTLQRTGLVQEDVNIMVRAGSTLYASGNPRVGSDAIWSNPKTQAFGMAEILEVDLECVRIAYRFQTRRQPKTQTVNTRRCLVGDRWVLSD